MFRHGRLVRAATITLSVSAALSLSACDLPFIGHDEPAPEGSAQHEEESAPAYVGNWKYATIDITGASVADGKQNDMSTMKSMVSQSLSGDGYVLSISDDGTWSAYFGSYASGRWEEDGAGGVISSVDKDAGGGPVSMQSLKGLYFTEDNGNLILVSKIDEHVSFAYRFTPDDEHTADASAKEHGAEGSGEYKRQLALGSSGGERAQKPAQDTEPDPDSMPATDLVAQWTVTSTTEISHGSAIEQVAKGKIGKRRCNIILRANGQYTIDISGSFSKGTWSKTSSTGGDIILPNGQTAHMELSGTQMLMTDPNFDGQSLTWETGKVGTRF